METAGRLVRLVVELATGVKHGQDHLESGSVRVDVVLTDRDTTALVLHGDTAVVMDDDLDFLSETDRGLVDRVVHHFVDKMMQTFRSRGPDIHGRPFLDSLKAFEDHDIALVVGPLYALSVVCRHGEFSSTVSFAQQLNYWASRASPTYRRVGVCFVPKVLRPRTLRRALNRLGGSGSLLTPRPQPMRVTRIAPKSYKNLDFLSRKQTQ